MSPEQLIEVLENRQRALETRMDELDAKLEKVLILLHKIEGASTLAKIVFFALIPLITIGNWIRDHIK